MLWHPTPLQNLAMYNVFSFLAVFPLPESYQNDPKFHFNTLLRSDTQKSSKNVENTTVFWSRCETVFGVWSRCETVFAPPTPAKADIATAILTNVIEHLVLLLPPNKHAFTAKAVWADFGVLSGSNLSSTYSDILFWHSIWYIIGDSLWLRSGGKHSDPELAVEVRQGTL